ncbi:HbrB-like-domain-containing protein [Phaeosphaeriaceae sp. PMI808]|nr:HbrB-like-domain-containing protein [Phaeosphaeriaceae sp. PMI808]
MQSSSPRPQTPILSRPSLHLQHDSDSDSDGSQVTLQQRRSPLPVSSARSTSSPIVPESSASAPAPAPAPAPVSAPVPVPATYNFSRPGVARGETEHAAHIQAHIGAQIGHRPRQRSQGYFEPSLSSARTLDKDSIMPSHNSHLNTSQIAAQAAYAHQQAQQQHNRKRSTTIPAPGDNNPPGRGQPMSPPPLPTQVTFKTNGMTYQNSPVGVNRMAATAAANVVFPRSPLHSPGIEGSQPQPHASPKPAPTPEPLQLQKSKEGKSSKMKLFSSKPKNIKVDRQGDSRIQPLPSPGKIGIGIHSSQALNRMMLNQSTTSLVDQQVGSSSSASLYSSANTSTSTLVPPRSDSFLPPAQREEKHKHHFLSRQKHKLKDKDEYSLPLSSANSNSRPTDPSAPQPLYSFAAPSSPGHSSAFPGSVTGLDLRHGGRNLRRAKKEEKAAAYLDAQLDPPYRERNQSFSTERSEWPSLGTGSNTTPGHTTPSQAHTTEMMNLGSSFGLNGLSPDDAWPLLKARVLLIFEGEDPRPPVEDFNTLVSVHIKRCVHKRSPILIIEDLNELLYTGFGSLDQTLRHVPDDRLIPHLVEMWLVVFTTILPFLQAVFLPLDLEFRGSGIMTSAAAAEFWGVMLPDEMNTKSPENKNIPILGELEVRRIALLMFRDIVILPRYNSLMAIFSRLSLENLNAGLEYPSPIPTERPSTANSTPENPPSTLNSTSQSSTGYLESMTSSSFASTRSRATSNTSAGSFSSNPSQHQHLHPPLPEVDASPSNSRLTRHPRFPAVQHKPYNSPHATRPQPGVSTDESDDPHPLWQTDFDSPEALPHQTNPLSQL